MRTLSVESQVPAQAMLGLVVSVTGGDQRINGILWELRDWSGDASVIGRSNEQKVVHEYTPARNEF